MDKDKLELSVSVARSYIGIKVHKMFCQRPLSGLSVTIKWALRDQVTGIKRTSDGHSLPVLRA